MLVLTRKPGERIVIGDDIVVTLVSIRRDDQYGDKIRIGLEAPSHVPIRREEVPDPREGASPSSSESSLDSLEGESRQLRQLTDTPDVAEMQPAVAPDGRTLAFADWEGDVVYVAPISGLARDGGRT